MSDKARTTRTRKRLAYSPPPFFQEMGELIEIPDLEPLAVDNDDSDYEFDSSGHATSDSTASCCCSIDHPRHGYPNLDFMNPYSSYGYGSYYPMYAGGRGYYPTDKGRKKRKTGKIECMAEDAYGPQTPCFLPVFPVGPTGVWCGGCCCSGGHSDTNDVQVEFGAPGVTYSGGRAGRGAGDGRQKQQVIIGGNERGGGDGRRYHNYCHGHSPDHDHRRRRKKKQIYKQPKKQRGKPKRRVVEEWSSASDSSGSGIDGGSDEPRRYEWERTAEEVEELRPRVERRRRMRREWERVGVSSDDEPYSQPRKPQKEKTDRGKWRKGWSVNWGHGRKKTQRFWPRDDTGANNDRGSESDESDPPPPPKKKKNTTRLKGEVPPPREYPESGPDNDYDDGSSEGEGASHEAVVGRRVAARVKQKSTSVGRGRTITRERRSM